MTLQKRVKTLEARKHRLQTLAEQGTLTHAELESLTLEELAALYHRLNREQTGRPDLGEFMAKLDAMPDAELLALYQSYGGQP